MAFYSCFGRNISPSTAEERLKDEPPGNLASNHVI